MKRITFEIDDELFYMLKVYCIKNKITFRKFFTNHIKEKIK